MFRHARGLFFVFMIFACSGCTEHATRSVFDEEEMSHYSSSAEQIESGVRAAKAESIPDARRMKEIAQAAAEAAAKQ